MLRSKGAPEIFMSQDPEFPVQGKLHPTQFHVNEVWIAFQVNDLPLITEQDGALDVICLMDAASCFILANTFVRAGESDPSERDAKDLLKSGWEYKREYPATLFLPEGQLQITLPAEAKRHDISVVSVPEHQLMVFIGEARQAFREHMQRSDGDA